MNGGREIALADVMFVDTGKRTLGFTSAASATSADERRCFSIVTSNQSLDLEASSSMEREAMVQGFSMLISHTEEGQAHV